MRTVTIHIAKTHLSRLLEEVAAGEEIVTAKAGKPVARLLPYAPKREPRQPGPLKGKIWIADDFDDRCPRRSWRRFAVSVPEISARHPPGDLPRHHDDPATGCWSPRRSPRASP